MLDDVVVVVEDDEECRGYGVGELSLTNVSDTERQEKGGGGSEEVAQAPLAGERQTGHEALLRAGEATHLRRQCS